MFNNNNLALSSYKIYKNILINHINTSIANKLIDKNPDNDRLIYSSQDPYYNGIGRFIRNETCWLNGVSNISCFSPAQLSGANWRQRGGTLVTKKHFILGKHFQFTVGFPIIFVDNNNNVIRRNLVSYAYDTAATDIAVGLLDAEVPDNIKVAKVLPSNYEKYIGYPQDLLSISLDQEEKASVTVWEGLLNNIGTGGLYQYVYIQPLNNNSLPKYIQYSAFSETSVVGDSGNPLFIIIDNDLVMIGYWHTYISGPFLSFRYDAINTLINTLSPDEGYSLTPVDLASVYQKYY